MPLYKSITHSTGARVWIWNITESEDYLREPIQLTANSTSRLVSMRDALHRKGFLSIRHLLALAGYTDFDLYYDSNGKPHLTDGQHISITHSFEFTAIIIADFPVGIDIEKIRPKVDRIAVKFIKYESLPENDEARYERLTQIWCIKESVYKLLSTPGLSFKRNVYVGDDSTTCIYEANTYLFNQEFEPLPGFMCGYIVPA